MLGHDRPCTQPRWREAVEGHRALRRGAAFSNMRRNRSLRLVGHWTGDQASGLDMMQRDTGSQLTDVAGALNTGSGGRLGEIHDAGFGWKIENRSFCWRWRNESC